MPILSLCIPSLGDRFGSLEELINSIHAQPRSADVELVIEIDDGQITTGAKRNRLVARATGDYIAHVDDDDRISPHYVDRVLTAIETAPVRPVDVVLIGGMRAIPQKGATRPHHAHAFDFRLRDRYNQSCRDSVMDGRTFWQWPNHLCPVRAPLAKATPFPDVTRGEDIVYKRDLFPKLRTSVHANPGGEPLYFYWFNPVKPARRTGP